MLCNSAQQSGHCIGAGHWITEVIGLLIWNLRSLKFDKFCLLQTNSCHVAGKKGLVIYFLILMYQKLFDYFFWIFKKMNFNPRETLKVRKWKNWPLKCKESLLATLTYFWNRNNSTVEQGKFVTCVLATLWVEGRREGSALMMGVCYWKKLQNTENPIHLI